jgi:hypothetical protein
MCRITSEATLKCSSAPGNFQIADTDRPEVAQMKFLLLLLCYKCYSLPTSRICNGDKYKALDARRENGEMNYVI